jgi:hypothetical protein
VAKHCRNRGLFVIESIQAVVATVLAATPAAAVLHFLQQ